MPPPDLWVVPIGTLSLNLPLWLWSIESSCFSLMVSRHREPLLGFGILRPLVGFLNPPTLLGPSSIDSGDVVMVALLLPLMTLCSPNAECSAMVEGCSRIGATAGVAERELQMWVSLVWLPS